MMKLNEEDENALKECIQRMKKLPFVKNIEFGEFDNCSTIIIRLSEMNRDTERKIYQIEYNLMQDFTDYVNFVVLPVLK